METTIDDCWQWLDMDVTMSIFLCLSDSADVVHAGAVSRFWRQFMIENGISKQVCVSKFPQLSSIAQIVEQGSSEQEIPKTEHKVYASLHKAIEMLLASPPSEFIDSAIGASSTDNFPLESISNTLYPRDAYMGRASYWSSKGHKNPNVPETLIYKLKANFGVVTEFRIQPFEAFFQPGKPIYSAKSVRFRVGYPKCSTEISSLELPTQLPVDDKFVWTYTSKEFLMSQENILQVFKLPEPVLCIGGYLQIELLGRVQTQEMDDLFYICVSHVKAMGRSLSPGFEVKVLERSGKFLMMYNREAFECMLLTIANTEEEASGEFNEAERRMGLLGYLLGAGHPPDDIYPWGNEGVEFDEEEDDDIGI